MKSFPKSRSALCLKSGLCKSCRKLYSNIEDFFLLDTDGKCSKVKLSMYVVLHFKIYFKVGLYKHGNRKFQLDPMKWPSDQQIILSIFKLSLDLSLQPTSHPLAPSNSERTSDGLNWNMRIK